MGVCDRVKSVWKSAPNATGASCPQVHYSHWHWANWLTWLCSCGAMTLKMRMGKVISREGGEGSKRLLGGGGGIVKVETHGSALTYLWLLFIRPFWLCGSVSRTFMNHTDKICWFTNLWGDYRDGMMWNQKKKSWRAFKSVILITDEMFKSCKDLRLSSLYHRNFRVFCRWSKQDKNKLFEDITFMTASS